MLRHLQKKISILILAGYFASGLSAAQNVSQPVSLVSAVTAVTPAENPVEIQFKKIDELIALGTPGLALRITKKNQPDLNKKNLEIWLLWEQKRILLLEYLERWDEIVKRIAQQEPSLKRFTVATADRNWFLTRKVKANLQLNNNQQALEQLQELLWNVNAYVSSDVIAMWRRLIIRTYMNMGLLEDAQHAMRRYQQDYGEMGNEDGVKWKLLQAKLLLQTGRSRQAILLLDNEQTAAADALLLMAKLYEDVATATGIKNQLIKKLADPELNETNQRLYWYVLLHVFRAMQDHAGQIDALEQLLSMEGRRYLSDVFFDVEQFVSADALWDVYQIYGESLANQYKLLRGNDEAWYVEASNLFESEPLKSRALFSELAFSAQQQQHRHVAMHQLVKLLEKQEAGLRLINQLFLHSKRITDIEQVPAEVRYRLVDYALEQADLKSAARLMEKLKQPPEGEDGFAWSLRRARVLILGGQYEEGARLMKSLLTIDQQLEAQQIDQYMQVVFDFQNVQQHDLALSLFKNLEQLEITAKLQREILFWKAESYQARGDKNSDDFEQAAFLFLKSAKPLDNVIDPWFHTASFRAAEALAEAGLIDDARRQYLKLLRFTSNTARKAVIQQRLQQLRLKQGKQLDEAAQVSSAR
ncbi:MAG: hypothetical protein OQL06_05700 [Gammaproteobacteria bacterium]|nr:hypothetical protein [Gammaproteobacteria bacterium]